MLVQVGDYWINSDHVTAVRESTLDDSQTCVWVIGSSAVDGAFLIDMECADVIEALNTVQMHELAEQLLADMEAEREGRPGHISAETWDSLGEKMKRSLAG